MKSYIIGIALFILFMFFTIFQSDYNRHQEQLQLLKYVAEEAAAAAAQYIIPNYYKEGYLVFNQTAGNLSANSVVRENMRLDSNLQPTLYSHWKEQISYMIDYYDDLNTEYPYELSRPEFNLVLMITAPTVIVTLNAGKADYRFYKEPPDILTLAAHEWQDR